MVILLLYDKVGSYPGWMLEGHWGTDLLRVGLLQLMVYSLAHAATTCALITVKCGINIQDLFSLR